MNPKTNRRLSLLLVVPAAAALCIYPLARASASWNIDRIIGRSAPLVPPPPSGPRSGAIAVVTDPDNIPLSNKFGSANSVGLADSGDVILSIGQTALFRWQVSDGSRTRLLQSNDPAPDFPGSLTDVLNAPSYNSLGHFAAPNNYVVQGQPAMRQLLSYDGAGFHSLAKRGDIAPDSGGQTFINFGVTRINDLDQVAFIGNLGTIAAVSSGVYTASASGSPVKIAVVGDAAPGGGTFTGNYTLIGINNSGTSPLRRMFRTGRLTWGCSSKMDPGFTKSPGFRMQQPAPRVPSAQSLRTRYSSTTTATWPSPRTWLVVGQSRKDFGLAMPLAQTRNWWSIPMPPARRWVGLLLPSR